MIRLLAALTLMLVGSLPVGVGAQEPDNPLHGLEGTMQGLSRSDLEAALSARQSCQTLTRLINELGGHWQDMREGQVERAAYLSKHQDARVEWDIRWGACAGARRDLSEGLPRRVLDHEVAILKRLWQGLSSVSEALLDDRPSAQINKTAAVYERALSQWITDLPAMASFWAGDGLDDQPASDGCVAATELAQQQLAVQLMSTAGVGSEAEGAETLQSLRSTLTEADRIRRECSHKSPIEEVELQLLSRSMRSYRRLFEALVEQDDAAVREAMITAQSTLSRLERCRQEHRSGGAISSTCTAR
jgi:hypothetical protein